MKRLCRQAPCRSQVTPRDTLIPLKRVSLLPTDTVHGQAPGSPHKRPAALDSVFRPDNTGGTNPAGGPCPGDYIAKTAKVLDGDTRCGLETAPLDQTPAGAYSPRRRYPGGLQDHRPGTASFALGLVTVAACRTPPLRVAMPPLRVAMPAGCTMLIPGDAWAMRPTRHDAVLFGLLLQVIDVLGRTPTGSGAGCGGGRSGGTPSPTKRASMLRPLQKSPTWRVPLWRRSRTWRLHRKVRFARVRPSLCQRREPFWQRERWLAISPNCLLC